MALTHGRAYTLTNIINADKERAKHLLKLGPEEATAQINALGYDFKVEEIREFGYAIRRYNGGHVKDNVLDEISGGVMIDISMFASFIDEIRW